MKSLLCGFLFLCCAVLPVNAEETDLPENEKVTSGDKLQNIDEVKDQADVNAETNKTGEETATAEPVVMEPEVIYAEEEVFEPKFMKNLISCKPDSASNGEDEVIISGLKNGSCILQYANFDLTVPLTLLGNIHGFDDLDTLLKNKDIAHYNYKADYIYEGLMYAVDACYNKKDYEGKRDELTDEYVTISRGLYAEFFDGICTVYLDNSQNVEGVLTDNGVICALPYKEIAGLEENIKDLVAKYGEKRGFGADGRITITRAQTNKYTDEADTALMYYMQQNGFCKKKSGNL